jgi:HAMP domain-containing protein
VDDATALSWIEKVANVSLFLVALGVVGEFASSWVAGPIRKRLETAKDLEIAQLNKDAGDARKSASEAIERAAKLEKEAADLNRKAEEERQARVKLEEYNSPRLINDKQAEVLLAELKPLRGKKLVLMTLVGDPETAGFAQRLLGILKSAGLDVAPSSGMMTITPAGLSFTIGANRGPDAEVLGNALIKAGIASKPIQAQIDQQTPDTLVLVVAPKH